MAMAQVVPGVTSDIAWATPMGTLRAVRGLNIRWRLGQLETLGLFGRLRNLAGEQLSVPLINNVPVRAVYTSSFGGGVQILAGSANAVWLIDVDPGSTTEGGNRYRVTQLGTGSLEPSADDSLPSPSRKRTVIAPVWWFAEIDDVIIGQRAGVDESPRAWDRESSSLFEPLKAYADEDDLGDPTGEAPKRAVAAGILGRILILLGAEQFGVDDPGNWRLSVRWSARRNFELWDPTIAIDPVTGDANTSGGLLLDGGSRIMGGGLCSFGVVVWTDRNMAMLNETGQLATVIGRTYIDGARGLLANNAWCDADGQLWWLDENRVLNVFDGGRPRQIPNPMRRGTIDRVNETAAARIYIEPNPEFSEIIIWYPADESFECNRAMVYNYLEDAWSIWGLNRSAWAPRAGFQETVGVALGGQVFGHDLGPSCPSAYRPDAIPEALGPGTGCGDGDLIASDLVEPIVGFVEFAPMVLDGMGTLTHSSTRLTMDWLPSPAAGAESDTLDVTAFAFREISVRSQAFSEQQEWTQNDTRVDYRVGGRAVGIRVEFEDIKSVYRLGLVDVAGSDSDGGER